jgi:hypothetical protein
MWLLLVPLAIVLVVVMSVVGAAMAIVAVAHALPWLMILAGIWLVVAASRDRGHRWRTAAAPAGHRPSPPRPAPPPPRMARPAAPGPVGSKSGSAPVGATAGPTPAAAPPRRSLPVDVQVKVEQIRHKADLLLGYAGRFPPFSQDLHIVRQTAADYLPRTINAYLALPGDDDPLVAETGNTALQELRAQLDLLDGRLDEVALDLQRQDLDRLVANRRFLEDRFRPIDRDAPGQESGAA